MAISVGGNKGLENEINVVPMIDILLVLLIIFMAALPSMRKAIDIQLPDPNPTVQPANPQSNQIVLEVNPGGQFSINTEKVDKGNLGPRLKEIYEDRKSTRLNSSHSQISYAVFCLKKKKKKKKH